MAGRVTRSDVFDNAALCWSELPPQYGERESFIGAKPNYVDDLHGLSQC